MRGRLWGWLMGTIAVSVAAFVVVMAVGWAPLLGLDLQGGISVVYKPAHPVKTDILNQTTDIIRNRVNAFGVSQPNISVSGGNISVQLPGIKDRAKALAVIGQTAQLRFRPVLCQVAPYSLAKGQKEPPSLKGAPPACPTTAAAQAKFAKIGNTPRSLDKKSSKVLLPLRPGKQGAPVSTRYIMGPSVANGTIVKTATAGIPQNGGAWQVDLTLTGKGAPVWNRIAKANFHKQLAIVLDGVVESAPVIQPSQTVFSSFGNQAQITGSFTQSQAQNLALELRFGALPVQLVQQAVHSVSPTLGAAALRAGLAAAAVGLILVFLYTVFYYRALGVVVLLGLVTTALLLWAIISALSHSAFHLSLDLSGITGLIVSVGVVADSYIVFFERLKEEVRSGKSVRASVDRGFTMAFRTIIAADLVSLIGALVLWLFSVGQVKGFAFYLGLSTLLDMITAWTFTRPFVILLGRNRAFTEARFIGVARGLASPGSSDGHGAPQRLRPRSATAASRS